jgi:hypothetical protein
MPSSGTLRRVALVITDVSVECIARRFVTLTSVITRATRRNTPEDSILHSPRRENLKSLLSLFGQMMALCCRLKNVFRSSLLLSSAPAHTYYKLSVQQNVHIRRVKVKLSPWLTN